MIIIPREKPVVKELNSYYLNIDKLIEHYQGELGAGAIYFRSQAAEAVLFFDEQSLVNGCLEDRKQQVQGEQAVDRIMEKAGDNNFAVSVYRILPERIYFWANLPNSRHLYQDLTSEFTDLGGLIKKMEGEKLTGFIDVELNNGEGGLLFFYKGQVIGGSSADQGGDVDRSTEYRDDLILRAKKHGGRFNVSRVFMEPEEAEAAGRNNKSGAAAQETGAASVKAAPEQGAGQISRERVTEMLQGLLGILETLVRKNRKIRSDFETLLNRKFVEKADKFDFLDPFLAEFKYSGGKITYNGTAGPNELVSAIEECVYEIAHENGLLSQLRSRLDDWRSQFADEIVGFDVRL